jgi:hypothetical protein
MTLQISFESASIKVQPVCVPRRLMSARAVAPSAPSRTPTTRWWSRSVRETWATKSPREAHKVLSGPDIQVTNLSDKTIHLGKIMELDNEVHQAFQKTEVSAFEPSSP